MLLPSSAAPASFAPTHSEHPGQKEAFESYKAGEDGKTEGEFYVAEMVFHTMH